MLFDTAQRMNDGLVVEYGGVLYINGQGYDPATLQRLYGKTLGGLQYHYNSGWVTGAPVALDRFMTEDRTSIYDARSNLISPTNFDFPTSPDQVVAGFLRGQCSSQIYGNTLVLNPYVGPSSGYYEDDLSNPTEPRISLKSTNSGSAPSGASGTPSTTVLKGYRLPVVASSYRHLNQASYCNIAFRVEDGAAVRAYNANTIWPGNVVDISGSSALMLVTNTSAAIARRINLDTMAATDLFTMNLTGSAGQGDQGPGFWAACSAQVVGGKSRVYGLAVRSSGTMTGLMGIYGEYDTLDGAVTGNFKTAAIDMNGLTVTKGNQFTMSNLYYVRASNGKNYLTAFCQNTMVGGIGEVLVFEEVALGQLKLISVNIDTIPNAMRCVFVVDNNHKEWYVMTGVGVDNWRWDEAKLRPVRVATITDIPPAAVGLDSMKRLWIVERRTSQFGSSVKIHMFPPSGTVAFIETDFADQAYDYTGSPIVTAVLGRCKDKDGQRVAAQIAIELNGPAVFEDGTKVKQVVTSASADVSTPIRIIGPGQVGVRGS